MRRFFRGLPINTQLDEYRSAFRARVLEWKPSDRKPAAPDLVGRSTRARAPAGRKMMAMQYLWDGTPETFSAMMEQHNAGAEILCSKCRSPLIMVLDAEGVAKHGKHHGIYCPKDERHVMVMMNMRGKQR